MTPGDIRQVLASGTAYSLTNAAATLDFGTTDPTLILNGPGNWLIFASVTVKNNGATFAANRTFTFKLKETNNRNADITGATTTQTTDVVTTQTISYRIQIPPVLYTTTSDSNSDTIAIQGLVSVVPTAGSIDVTEASIIAIRLC